MNNHYIQKGIICCSLFLAGCQATQDAFQPVENDTKTEYMYHRDFSSGSPIVKQGLLGKYEVDPVSLDLDSKTVEEAIVQAINNQIDTLLQYDLPHQNEKDLTIDATSLNKTIHTSCNQKNNLLSCNIQRSLKDEEKNLMIQDFFPMTFSLVDGHELNLQEILNREDAYDFMNECLDEQLPLVLSKNDSLEELTEKIVIDENTLFLLGDYENRIIFIFNDMALSSSNENLSVSLMLPLSLEEVVPIYDLLSLEPNLQDPLTQVFMPHFIYPQEPKFIDIGDTGVLLHEPCWIQDDEVFLQSIYDDIKQVVEQLQMEENHSISVDMDFMGQFYSLQYKILGNTRVKFSHFFKYDHTPFKIEELFDDPQELYNHITYQKLSAFPYFSFKLAEYGIELSALVSGEMMIELIPYHGFNTLNLEKWNR